MRIGDLVKDTRFTTVFGRFCGFHVVGGVVYARVLYGWNTRVIYESLEHIRKATLFERFLNWIDYL